jgi:hypothetical protein
MIKERMRLSVVGEEAQKMTSFSEEQMALRFPKGTR